MNPLAATLAAFRDVEEARALELGRTLSARKELRTLVFNHSSELPRG